MIRRPLARPVAGGASQQGIGLIEVLVAMTIGLLLLGGVGYMFLGSKQMNTAQTDIVRIQESTRNALDVVGSAVRQAGYRLNPDEPTISQPYLDGRADGNSDILIVRHDPNWVVDVPVAPALPNRYLGRERNCEGDVVTSDNTPNAVTADSPVNTKLIVYQFKVVDNKLMCYADAANPPTTKGVVVADNVERMKIQYGLGNGSETVTSYVDLPDAAQFTLASVVRVNLLMRGPSNGVAIGSQTVKFNGAPVVTNDGHLRRVVTSTFNVRNRSRF